jgi:hypothetical protein
MRQLLRLWSDPLLTHHVGREPGVWKVMRKGGFAGRFRETVRDYPPPAAMRGDSAQACERDFVSVLHSSHLVAVIAPKFAPT